MNNTIKIAIANNEPLFRQGISSILNSEKEFEILFEAENGMQLINLIEHSEIQPSIILMDSQMPVLSGVETTKIIYKKFPQVKIIAFSLCNSYKKSLISNMINVGAVSYLPKNTTINEVIYAIKRVYLKGFYYEENVLEIIDGNLLHSNKKNKTGNSNSQGLTKREKEILELICEQYTTSEIAEKLFISPRTVEGHRNNLLIKTGSKNAVGLIVYAFQNKLVAV